MIFEHEFAAEAYLKAKGWVLHHKGFWHKDIPGHTTIIRIRPIGEWFATVMF